MIPLNVRRRRVPGLLRRRRLGRRLPPQRRAVRATVALSRDGRGKPPAATVVLLRLHGSRGGGGGGVHIVGLPLAGQ